jgi:Glycosyl hydrolases family 25
MFRWTPLALLAALLVVGCGKSVSMQTVPTPAIAPVCAPVVPAHMGVCVQQHFGLTLRASAPADGWDISVYQGEPPFPSSLRFVYNQVGDGTSYRDPNFSTNCTRERQRGIKCGAYLFVRPGNAYGQALVIASVASQTDLPPALDVEVPGAYAELCPIAADLKADFHVAIVVAYTAPGLWWGGSACGTRLWGAEWGTAGYAFSNWTSYVAQQTCGTCVVDEDVDHGLLALEHPTPKPPTHAQVVARLHRELDAHYRLRAQLRVLLTRHDCRKPPWSHSKPDTRPYAGACRTWLLQGAVENREISRFHRLLIY